MRTGTYSLSSNHTAAWGGMYLHHAGVSTTGSTHLTFAVRVPTAGTYIELESYGSGDTLLGTVVLNDYIPGGSMAANTWYDVSIPLSALGASNTTFTGLVAMRATTGYVYWDDLNLVNVSAGGGGSSATTTLAYDNAGNLTTMGTSTYAWNYRNMLTQSGNGVATSTYTYDTDGARRKLTEAGVTTYFPSKYYEVTGTSTTKHIFAGDLLLATVQNGASSGGTSTTTTATIYDDATTWNDWSWDTTVNLNETTTVYSGTKSLKATYTAAWGRLYLQNSSGPSTAGATHLHFAVRSSTADPDVEIDAYGPGDNLLGYVTLDTYIPSMAANTWYVVDIPLTALGATNATLTGFSALRGTTGVLYFDEVRLVAAGQGGGGTASTTVRYVHADHLNSTNVVTDSTGAIVQTLDYYPYGGSRVNDSVGGADEKRKYIGQYTDAVSSLSYLNARYYDSARGQFTSQDPVFWGDPKKQDLMNPQNLNSYSYAAGNPIVRSDPTGLWYKEFVTGQQSWSSFYGEVGDAAYTLGQTNPGWNFAMNHPISTGAIVGVSAIPALSAGGSLSSAYAMATWPGVSATFASQHAFASLVYATLMGSNALSIPAVVNSVAALDRSNPSTFFSGVKTVGMHFGPDVIGGHVAAINDTIQFSKFVGNTLGSAAINLFSNSVQTRVQTTQSFNAATGGARAGSAPSNNSLWVTPSGAVVTFGGQLVSPPPSKK